MFHNQNNCPLPPKAKDKTDIHVHVYQTSLTSLSQCGMDEDLFLDVYKLFNESMYIKCVYLAHNILDIISVMKTNIAIFQ
jgi:hypothetical protein